MVVDLWDYNIRAGELHRPRYDAQHQHRSDQTGAVRTEATLEDWAHAAFGDLEWPVQPRVTTIVVRPGDRPEPVACSARMPRTECSPTITASAASG